MAYAQVLKHPGRVVVPSAVDVMAGFWVLVSPFAFAFRHESGTVGIQAGWGIASNMIVGAAIGFMALARCKTPSKHAGLSWLNMVLGLWVVISPWVLGFASVHGAAINNVIAGIVVMILGGCSATATEYSERVTLDASGREI